jgi:hypothetical protein
VLSGNDWNNVVYDSTPYSERVHGAPYFYNLQDGAAPNDMIPLDTSRYLIFIPELNGEGVLYTPEEPFNIPDVDPIRTEKIQTIEFGFKGLIGSADCDDVDLQWDQACLGFEWDCLDGIDNDGDGLIDCDDDLCKLLEWSCAPPTEADCSDGLDDDGDWETWASTEYFGWADDDLNGDGNNADPGEWGFVNYYDTSDSTNFTLYHPEDVVAIIAGGINFLTTDSDGNSIYPSFFDAVGIDEYHPTVGLNEAEIIPTGLIGSDGKQINGPGVAYSPTHLVLSPMNYGDVWMQGVDIGITQLIPEYDLMIDGNIAWYGTTEYYNKLTKKNDPINAPKWKLNPTLNWHLISI